jgi:cell division septation protein DedD
MPEPQPRAAEHLAQGFEGPCYVHVGVYANEHNTTLATQKLQSMDVFNVLVREVALESGKAVATQVRVGPFASRNVANQERARINEQFSGSLGGTACLQASVQ